MRSVSGFCARAANHAENAMAQSLIHQVIVRARQLIDEQTTLAGFYLPDGSTDIRR